jgi:hypothetical protein
MVSNIVRTFSTGVSSRMESWLAPATYPPPGFMMSRTLRVSCRTRSGVPITNYGLAIAYSLGIFERALSPFPAALDACRQMRKAARRN